MCRRKPAEPTLPDPHALRALEEFWPMFVNSRSLCGYMPDSLIGGKQFAPGSFYRGTTPYSRLEFKQPVTPEVRAAHNRIAAWTNENCVIRLWAILESHGLTKPIRDVVHAQEIRLLKHLRQHFAHGSGVYDASSRDHRSLRRQLLKLFPGLADSKGIPLNIDLVLRPLFDCCFEYAEAVLSVEGTPSVEQADRADCQ